MNFWQEPCILYWIVYNKCIFLDIKMKNTKLQQLPFFTLVSFSQLMGMSLPTARITLSRWEHAGKMVRLKRGLYITREFYLSHKDKHWFQVWVSSVMQKHSYVSREWVLQKHNVLTEITYGVTAMSLKNTRSFANQTGTYRYYHLQQKFFTGFGESNYYGVVCREASKAKALFDYLYSRKVSFPNVALEERLNIEDFSQEEIEEFTGYVKLAIFPKMHKILADFRKYVWL